MLPATLIVPIEGKGTGREGECGTPQVPKLLMEASIDYHTVVNLFQEINIP